MIAALTSLSSLARRASLLRFAPPEDALHLATSLLERLVTLCAAEQGALFFTPQSESLADPSVAALVASMHIDEEEATTLLARVKPAPTEALFRSADFPAILCWQRLLTLPRKDASNTETETATFLCTVLLVWPETAQQTGQAQACDLLPALADLVDAILFGIWTARIDAAGSGDVLPAEVLATVAHEFRSPLTTIQGYAGTLLRHDQQLGPEERQDFLQMISEAGTRLGKLTGRFLDLAQLETRSHPLESTLVNLLTQTQEIIELSWPDPSPRPVLSARSGPSGINEDTDLSYTLVGDLRLLRLLIHVLLENAMVYSQPASQIEVILEPGTPTLVHAALQAPLASEEHRKVIVATRFSDQEELLTLRVRDHGIGIAPQHLALIFRRFYRVDTSLTRQVNGPGLGLTLCKAIVELHQGMLWVESAAGRGSTFALALPRRFALAADTGVGA
jgi:signal transduction histidine kinase